MGSSLKKMSGVVWAGLALMCVLAASAGAKEVNLVKNGGFEGKFLPHPRGALAGTFPMNWNGQGGYEAKIEPETDAQHVHSGKQSVKMSRIDNVNNHTRIYTDRMPVAPGIEYTVRLWAKGSGQGGANLYQYNGRGSFVGTVNVIKGKGFAAPAFTLTKDWKEHLFTYKTEDDQIAYVCLVITFRGKGDEAGYFDDVSFNVDESLLPRVRTRVPATAGFSARMWQEGIEKTAKLYANGKGVSGRFDIVDGENVLALEITGVTAGERVGCKVQVEEGRCLHLNRFWKYSHSPAEGWTKPGFDDSSWESIQLKGNSAVFAKAGDCYLRRSVYWTENVEKNWLWGNPEDIYLPRGKMEYVMVAFRGLKAARPKSFQVVVEVPSGVELIPLTKHSGWGTAQKGCNMASKEAIVRNDQPYTRHVLDYDPRLVSPGDAKVGQRWQMQPPHKGTVSHGPIFLKAGADAGLGTFPLYIYRVADGNVTDMPLELKAHIVPEFSDARPSRIYFAQCGQLLFPAWIGLRPGHLRYLYPPEIVNQLYDGYLKRGYNFHLFGSHSGWASPGMKEIEDLKKPDFRKVVKHLDKQGVVLCYGWNTGMNYSFMVRDKKPEDFDGWHRIVLDHPEAQGKFYTGDEKLIPAVWKPGVYHRWFNEKMLFAHNEDFRRKNKPVFWSHEYMASGGKLYYDFWRSYFGKAKQYMPEAKYVLWDIEYPLVAWSSFAELDIEAFRKFAGVGKDVKLTDEVIAQKHAKKWVEFRFDQWARHAKRFNRMLHEVGMGLMIYDALPSEGHARMEGLDWKLLKGGVDFVWLGSPGSSPRRWFDGFRNGYKLLRGYIGPEPPVVGQLVYGISDPAQKLHLSQRKNDIMRCIALFRTGVNEWSTVNTLGEINGVSYFARQAVDLCIKYEDTFADGRLANEEFEIDGLKKKDYSAFRLEGKPVLLMIWNDGDRKAEVTLRWKTATPKATYVDGETGAEYGKGTSFGVTIEGHHMKVIECRR